jgi:copper chaperone CopZ
VRSALLAVKGVSRARVTLEDHEAVVWYDPGRATIQDLVDAVKNAKGPNTYSATVKK